MPDALAERIAEHGRESIMAAAYTERPYPQLAFDGFFPDDVYRRLMGGWPDPASYVNLNSAGTRKEFTLHDPTVDAGDDERNALWRSVREALEAPRLEDALRERLREGLEMRAKRSGEGWPVPMHARPVLYADYDGYAIKPHPDTRKKVVTMLIYMPADDSQRELGTTVYKVSPMGVFAWKTFGLVKAGQHPFLPNSGFAFVVIHPAHNPLRASWHGRAAIALSNDKPRMTIANTYYARPAVGAADAREYG